MIQVYQLNIRVLITEQDGLFKVEPLEIMGQVTASSEDEALRCLALCIEGALAVGEPFWREAPEELLKLWNRPSGEQADGSKIHRMILKIRGQRGSEHTIPQESVNHDPL
jgi:hypothetical protein